MLWSKIMALIDSGARVCFKKKKVTVCLGTGQIVDKNDINDLIEELQDLIPDDFEIEVIDDETIAKSPVDNIVVMPGGGGIVSLQIPEELIFEAENHDLLEAAISQKMASVRIPNMQ